jgi:tetratricopeptide (TPR) repeat protein
MVFLAEAFAGWLVSYLADASRRGLSSRLVGNKLEVALQEAATAAIQATAQELRPQPAPANEAQASDHLAHVIDHVFGEAPTPAEALATQATLLEGLEAGVAARLAVLGEAEITGTGQSSAELLGVDVTAVTESLIQHLLREILTRGVARGPLTALAAQLNHDLTHLQGQHHAASLRQLTQGLKTVLAGLEWRQPPPGSIPAPTTRAPGRPIGEVTDPFALEVHRAITVPTDTAALPVLPAYIERDHDRHLQAIVSQAIGGRSAAAVLVGGSSTGKTRACWEAVQRLPDDWRLWHPIDPSRPEAAAEAIAAVGPRTVVWLNEAQHYLFTLASGLGERIAAGLRELLRSPDRGPVLVLGTIWPEYWATLTSSPDPGQLEDPHAQARALLTGMDLAIPEAFTGAALQALEAAARMDPRLAEAAAQAQDGRITQFLAGVPALLERYRNAPPAARALIDAAMDARRLGHSLYLPLDLLEAAAPGYLTDQQWDQLDDDWLEQALAYRAAPCRGAQGPLTRVRARPSQPTPARVRVRLADYLEQTGRARRQTVLAPASLWDGFVQHAAQQDLPRIAQQAEGRSLYRHALQLHQRSAHAGNVPALRQAATIWRCAGHLDQAVDLYQRLARAGDPYALGQAGWLLEEAGRLDEALDLYQAHAEASHPFGRWRAAELLSAASRPDEAIEWLQSRAEEAGDHGARRQLAELLTEADRLDEAIALCQRAANDGDPYARTSRPAVPGGRPPG